VLAETAERLESARLDEDSVDANSLGELIANDPLMTLKVLAYASSHRGRPVVTPAQTVTAALVMMGISPFFRAFGPQPTVEDRLAAFPEALMGLHAAVRRAHRGANFALAFAVHRMDDHAAVVHTVCLLHEFAEILLWSHAPRLQLEIQRRQRSDPGLRSVVAQREVLGIEICELQAELLRAWALPEFLAGVVPGGVSASRSMASVVELATRLARHSGNGWSNPALPDDVVAIAGLLNLSVSAAWRFVQEV
jgi:HD-like signal output (HDOD) protein